MGKEVLKATCDLNVGFTHLLFNLFAQGYSHICFVYSGGGDSGAIDQVTAFPTGSVHIEDNVVTVPKNTKEIDLDYDLKDHLENIVYSKILEDADDWWNNDGGGGTLWLDCRDGSYFGDHYIYIREVENSVLEGKLQD